MLCLSRRHDERIVIGTHVVVTVVAIRGDRVLLGIDAPPELEVDREEVRAVKDRRRRLTAAEEGRRGEGIDGGEEED
jgi:carbon storage regulator